MQVLYDLQVRLGFQYGGFSSGVTTVLGALGRLQQQMTAAGHTSARLNRSLGLLAGGMALTGAGMAGIGVMRGWVTAAGTMQEALAQVGITAKGTQGQLNALVGQSYTVANQTQFSAPQVLLAESVMGQLGFRDPSGKQSPRQVIGGAIADFMRGAEVAQHFQHTNYQQAVTAMSQMAHQFGTYSGAGLARNVALEIGASLASGMSLSEQANVVKYLTPAMKTMGVSPRDALALVAVAHQTGLTMGKGGSNLGALLRGFAPTGAPKHDHALAAMEHLAGGNFYNTQGEFVGIPAAMRLLNRFYDNPIISNEKRGVIAKTALGVQGSTAAAVLGNNTSILQYNAMRGQLGGDTPAWLKNTQTTLNMTLQGQLATLKGNLGSISALLGAPLMGPLGVAVHGFVELTGWVVTFLKTHPQIASFIATFTAVATAAALIAGPVLVAAGAFGILSAAGIVTAGAFLPFTAVVVGVVAAIAGAVWVFTHWGQVVLFLRTPLGVLTGALGAIGRTIGTVFGAIGATVGGSLATFGGILSVVGTLAGDLMLALSPLATFIRDVLGAVFRTVGGWITTTFVQPLLNLIGTIQIVIGWFLKWSDSIGVVKDATKWLGDQMHRFLDFLGVLHSGPAAHTVRAAPSVPTGVHALGGTTVGLPSTIPAVHLPSVPRLIGPLPRARSGAVSHPTSGHAGYVWHDPWAYTPPPVHAPPTPHAPHAPPVIPRKTGGMVLIGAGSLHATQQTTEVHHHHSPVHLHVHGTDHETRHSLVKEVVQATTKHITDAARWHNRYHAKGVFGMEPT